MARRRKLHSRDTVIGVGESARRWNTTGHLVSAEDAIAIARSTQDLKGRSSQSRLGKGPEAQAALGRSQPSGLC